MTTRREARRIAIDILYQADITGEEPSEAIKGWKSAGRDVSSFSEELVEGVAANGPEIDLLRVAVYELRHRPDVPPSVVISEAVEAASELSSDESRRFVNGILGRIAREDADTSER